MTYEKAKAALDKLGPRACEVYNYVDTCNFIHQRLVVEDVSNATVVCMKIRCDTNKEDGRVGIRVLDFWRLMDSGVLTKHMKAPHPFHRLNRGQIQRVLWLVRNPAWLKQPRRLVYDAMLAVGLYSETTYWRDAGVPRLIERAKMIVNK